MAWPRVDDRQSFVRYAGDAVLYRALTVAPASERLRTIRIGGAELTYRLQRGDIQAVREVWVEECYRPPAPIPFDTVVDLGTNIGLTSLWYARHGASRLLCVEPVPANMRLARRNLAQNGVTAEFVQAAVGARDGTARFRVDPSYSTRGHLDRDGELEVPVVSMATLVSRVGQVDLVKMDIEGAEIELLRAPESWIDRVNAIIIEFDRGDPRELGGVLNTHGFRYVPAFSVWWNSMDFFIRDTRPSGPYERR
jgi:FkbM family methyltransferase